MPPLSSAITRQPGSQSSNSSYLLPSFGWTGYLDRNINQASASGTDTRSVLVGNLVLQRVGPRSQLNLDYAGGVQAYGSSYWNNTNAVPPGWGTVQQLSFEATLTGPRWSWTLGDQGMYLPESPFGFPGFAGLQTFGGGSGGAYLGSQTQISPLVAANQSVLTGESRRYADTLLGEVDYKTSQRSTLTVTGTAGLIHFVDPGFINSRTGTILVGYDYLLTRRNEISLTYLDSEMEFSQAADAVLERGLLLGYQHEFSRKLSVSLSGGPAQNELALPLGGNVKLASWFMNDSLHYSFRLAGLSAGFYRFTNSGAGVTNGLTTELTSVSASWPFYGKSSLALGGGYAYNQSLRADLSGGRRSQYETWQAGVTLSREYGGHTSIYLQYQFQYQISANPICFLGGCRLYADRQLLGAGINWHGRPILLP
jgi:hypothetical protein